MKTTALYTSRLTEAICQLPGVATLDWADRAAAALTRLHPSSAAVVSVGRVDGRYVLSEVETTGAGGATPPNTPPRSLGELQSIRETIREGDWIGWDIRQPGEGAAFVNTLTVDPAPTRRGAPPLNLRWDAMRPSHVVVGAFALEGAFPGRMIVAEVALDNSTPQDAARVQAILSIALPQIAARYRNAIGTTAPDRYMWLTPREEMILWKLVSGKKVPQIAEELHRSIYTVHDHVKSLHRKLGATSRGQLVARALGHLGPLISHEAATARPDAEDDATAMGSRDPGGSSRLGRARA